MTQYLNKAYTFKRILHCPKCGDVRMSIFPNKDKYCIDCGMLLKKNDFDVINGQLVLLETK